MLDNVSRFQFGAAFNAVDVGIIVLDHQRCVVGWNEWMARVSHRPTETVLGKKFFDLFSDLGETRLRGVIDDAFEAGTSSILSHSLNTLLPLQSDGGQRLLHNIVVRPISSGQSNYCLLQINDVTLSVVRERVLRERQNARYHAIVDSAPDAIVTIDVEQTIQWVNGAAEHVFGYTSSELLGKKLDLLLGQGGNLSSALFAGPGGGRDRASAIQVVGRHKHGGVGHFDVSFGHWRADQRDFVTTIWRDVTERMAADAALRESESRQRSLLEALPQLVWTCSADGACTYFNPQWYSYAGGSEHEHLGHGWLKVVQESDRQDVEAAWTSSLANGAVFDVDTRLRRADGTYRWFKMRSIPISTDDGSISKWFGTATDITDLVEARNTLRKSNEELEARVDERTREREAALRQLHEAQKMESIGQLTGGVAHDFNNLLTVILGSLALLKKAVPDEPRISRLLERAIQGAERGATLTTRLLAFARRQELRVEVVEVQKLIPEMLDFLRQSVGPNISIGVDISPDVPAVEVDPNQLELALINLAVNARDAMPQGGSLTVTVQKETGLEPRNLPRAEYVRISVVDTGEGMDEATLAKAQEPFFTTKGIGKGTGLGLSMVQGFTAQSGGAMRITSQPGKGTDVRLWLPCAHNRAVAGAATAETEVVRPPSTRNLNVLLVDDDILVSMGAADMLMDLGHSVTEAQSAAAALKLLKSGSVFDLVVTDFAMPGMTGLDLALEIRRINPKLPVILATGYAELPPHKGHEFRRLAKPYTQADLAAAVDGAVKRT